MSSRETRRYEKGAKGLGPLIVMPSESSACGVPLPTRIAFIGNYLPRECGIATFTTDLCNALAYEYGPDRLFAIPVNDPESSYEYPEQVRLELEQEDLNSYEQAAEFLNFNGNDLVCMQHEYGIYGGAAGSHILNLLRKLKMPLVTTLHTVLRDPDVNQRAVLEEIARLSDRLVVMSELAAQLLREVYAVPGGKIDVIPHGVPEMPFMDPNYFKDLFGTEGKSVLLTFGLLSPNKGIENVIRALPAILARHPNVVYIVSGVTHPHIRRPATQSNCTMKRGPLLKSTISLAETPQSIAREQAKLQACVDQPLFTRSSANPILGRTDWPYPINSVFNPAAVLLPDGDTLLLCRVEDRTGLSHLCAARSRNGVDTWRIDPEPTLNSPWCKSGYVSSKESDV
jgi:hypothetical protein